MATLPPHPDLDQLRRQAKELLRAARAGQPDALARIGRVSGELVLAGAQLALAREYGFASWPALHEAVDARTREVAEQAREFVAVSVADWTGRAARMLETTSELAGHDFATAVVLGDAARVRTELERDPRLATRIDESTGWTALHAVCSSRWHHLDPARTDGLAEVARLLLDAGADPAAVGDPRPGRRGRRSPLGCATAAASTSAPNDPLIRLLLDRGARPGDRDLYLLAFSDRCHASMQLLLDHMPDAETTVTTGLTTPIGRNDIRTLRIMLDGGADPRRYRNGDDDQSTSPAYDAVTHRCSAELLELLLSRGADPDAPGPDGRSPYRAATAAGRDDLADALHRHGARADASDADHLLSDCMRGDTAAARRKLVRDPGLLDRLADSERAAIVTAAEAGNTDAVRAMLDIGFPLDARGHDGATPLHTAAYAGSAATVRLLLARGADPEARDTNWDTTPLTWALVGSGGAASNKPAAGWTDTVAALLDAGAETTDIELADDDPRPPSPAVVTLLRDRGIIG